MADDIQEMLVKVKGDISDLLAKYEAGKRATKDFEDTVDKSGKNMGSAFKDVEKGIDDVGTTSRQTSSSVQQDADEMKSKFISLGQGAEGVTGNLIQMGVAAAPFLAPVAAGSLLGVLGAGGLALGIAGQLHNADVQTAIAGLKEDLSSSLHDSTSAFGPELVKSIGIADAGVAGFLGSLKSGFNALAPELTLFTKTVSGGLLQAGPLFANAMARSRPDVQALGNLIADLSVGTGQFFNNLTIGAEGGAQAINALGTRLKELEGDLGTDLGVISQMVGQINSWEQAANNAGQGTGFWSKALGSVVQGAKDALDPMTQIQNAQTGINQLFHAGSTAAAGFDGSVQALTGNVTEALTPAEALAGAYSDLATSMDKAESSALTLDQAQLNLKQAQADLSSTLKKNKDNWNENTQAGRDDWSQLLNNLSAIQKVHDAQVANGGATAANTAAYYKNVDGLLAVAKKAGLSKDAIAKLKTQFEELPKSVNIPVTVKVKVSESDQAAQLLGMKTGQRGISANSGVWPSNMQRYANSGIAHFDSSGIFPATKGGIFRFAESSTGGEALIARNGDKNRGLSALTTAASWLNVDVVSHRATNPAIKYAGGNGGGTGPVHQLYATIEIDGKAVVRALTPAAQRRGGRNGGVTGLG